VVKTIFIAVVVVGFAVEFCSQGCSVQKCVLLQDRMNKPRDDGRQIDD
jgi:hypothetical protein